MTSLIRRGGAHILRLLESGADPAAVANAVEVYSKDDGGITQLFARASDGTITQLTPGGSSGAAGGNEIFLDGFDGSHTMDGVTAVTGCNLAGSTYTAQRDLNFQDLTIDDAIRLDTNGYRVFVNGTLTMIGSAAISNNGNSSTSGAGGTGASGNFFASSLSGGTGQANGVGGSATNTSGGHPRGSTGTGALGGGPGANGGDGNVACRGGGGGGAPATNGGGNGGGVTVTTAPGGGNSPVSLIRMRTDANTPVAWVGATGGGGGGGNGTGNGGGGGGGGGIVLVCSRIAIGIDSGGQSGFIEANGGDGFEGTGGGGGGGGGGGITAWFYGTRSGGITQRALGGAGGIATTTGGNGGDGADGHAFTFNVWGDGT